MINYTNGNILETKVEALINSVNCAGIIEKEIALQFKQIYPSNFHAYATTCKEGRMQLGRIFTTKVDSVRPPHFIINFTIKRHWQDKSRLKDIGIGLQTLVKEVQRLETRSIAIPPLGCGNSGLDWMNVHQRIEAALKALPNIQIIIYESDRAHLYLIQRSLSSKT